VQLSQFEHYVHRYSDRVYGFAFRMLDNRDDARDVTQDVLIRLWRYDDFLPADKVLPWLMRVTRNACIDLLRHRKMARQWMESGTEIEELSLDVPGAADEVERRDERRMIEEALGRIPEPHRSLLILREIQHLKYEEISGAMDLPINTVKVYLHRGRKMLRELLTEMMDSDRVRSQA